MWKTKLRAEKLLLDLSFGTEMETIIIRAPLIYGPGVKGNFLNLMTVYGRGLPLPFKSINNKRSFLFLGNLADACEKLLKVKNISEEVFFISDGTSVSTADLTEKISRSLGTKPRLFSIPTIILVLVGKLLGKSLNINRLTGSLEVDDSKFKRMLGWTPPFNMLQGLKVTAKWFHDNLKLQK